MEDKSGLFTLSIDPVTRSHLGDISRWAKFISLSGMLLLLMGMVVSVLDATVLDNSLGVAVLINGAKAGSGTPTMRLATATGTLLLTALVFFPLYFLFLFSRRMNRALDGNSQSELNGSFTELKKCLRYLGILLLVFVLLSVLVLLLAVLFTAA